MLLPIDEHCRIPDRGNYWHLGQEVTYLPKKARPYEHPQVTKKREQEPLGAQDYTDLVDQKIAERRLAREDRRKERELKNDRIARKGTPSKSRWPTPAARLGVLHSPSVPHVRSYDTLGRGFAHQRRCQSTQVTQRCSHRPDSSGHRKAYTANERASQCSQPPWQSRGTDSERGRPSRNAIGQGAARGVRGARHPPHPRRGLQIAQPQGKS